MWKYILIDLIIIDIMYGIIDYIVTSVRVAYKKARDEKKGGE